MLKPDERYLILSGNPNSGGIDVNFLNSEQELQQQINEDNDASIREDCRPKYLRPTDALTRELKLRYPEQMILKVSPVMPKPVKVVERYVLPE